MLALKSPMENSCVALPLRRACLLFRDIDDRGEDEADRNSVDDWGGAKPDNVEPTFCPPHPGYMWNICIRCGKAKEEDDDEKGVALRYLHQVESH
jgi:hypothetical protein